MSGIADDLGHLKHSEAIGYFNNLIIDLKLQTLGKEPREPFTMERLDEATRHVQKLMECREKVRYR